MSKFIYEPKAPWIDQSHFVRLFKSSGKNTMEDFREEAATKTEEFWSLVLKDMPLNFDRTPTKILEKALPWPVWVPGTKLSVVENCIDRHLSQRAKETALIFESDDEQDIHEWSFQDLYSHSSYIAELLDQAGAKPGDRAALLMPMSLEMVASFFGVLRAGLSVIPIFSGYGAEAIAARLQDAEVKFVFVQEETYRRGKAVPVLQSLHSLLPTCPSVKKVFTLKRTDFLEKKFGSHSRKASVTESEAECLLLYTSGTTGKPKACVHTHFGVLATCGKEHRYSFDVHQEDRFFWYTDIGWMMGPWELIGALQHGAAVVLYEGTPDFPDADRLWRILDRHSVTHFGISPTAIRSLKKNDSSFLRSKDFPELRILGSTGEPWDEESWLWYFKEVGKSRCPVMNISGGTEIMGCLLGPSPVDPLKPATLGRPMIGVNAQVWSEEGERLTKGLGHLVCLSALPSMTKSFLNNSEKYLETYFSKFGEDVWYHGDWAFIDDSGLWYLRGRSDDTIKVAGKRIGPNEYESALMENPVVQECAAIGLPHELKGEGVHCFVVLKAGTAHSDELRQNLHKCLQEKLGKAFSAEKILFVKSLPKTRSGKILRALIRKICLTEDIDESAVENPESLESIRNPL